MPIQDIELNNITISGETGFTSNDAQNIHLHNVNFLAVQGSVYSLNNSKDFIMQNREYTKDAALFMKREGKTTGNIQLIHTDLSKARKNIEFGEEFNKDALIQK